MKPNAPGGRSHPPSLLRLAERLIRDEALFSRGDVVLCACSGGPDSTALLHVLALLRPRIGHQLVAHGVDHGLRPEARAELEIAANLAASLGVPFGFSRVNVEKGGNLQARARSARLAALREGALAAGASRIATGHTADDRAETFLLRLLRGAGPKGLAVLPPKAAFPIAPPSDVPPRVDSPTGPRPALELIRPLLTARRSDVIEHLGRHAIAFAEDPSNLDPRFTRVRVRRELVPLLEGLSPKIVEHITFLADALANVGASGAGEDTGEDADSTERIDPKSLGREQRKAIDRARRLGRSSVKLRVKEGRDVEATFPGGRIVLIEGEPRSTPHDPSGIIDLDPPSK